MENVKGSQIHSGIGDNIINNYYPSVDHGNKLNFSFVRNLVSFSNVESNIYAGKRFISKMFECNCVTFF